MTGPEAIPRPDLPRAEVGAAKQQLEIPLDVVADIPTKVDSSVPWREKSWVISWWFRGI